MIAVKPANCVEVQPESWPNQKSSYAVPEAKQTKLSILEKGDRAIYQTTGEPITIDKVHSEDDPSDPYYTCIMSSDGREKQTTRNKLSLEARLDVGGTPFVEQLSILCMEGDLLSKFDASAEGMSVNRDATHFPTVLTYLTFLADAAAQSEKKPQRPNLPDSRGGLKKLKKEAEFFGLGGLETMCADKMCNLVL